MLNKATLIGHLGKDPESRFTPSGDQVVTFSLATSEKWTDKAGEKQERTSWHRVEVWGKQSKFCGDVFVKGSLVYVEGKIQYDEWEKDGVKRTSTKIRADRAIILGGGRPRGEQVHPSREPGQDDGPEW
jgi:single-strand DNA-binding protein